MGVVCKSEDIKLGRTVTLKFLPEELFQDPQAVKRSQRETRADLFSFGLVLYEMASGMPGYRQVAMLRVRVFLCGAILGRAGRRTVRHLSSAWGGHEQR
jgi:serine/threonine protein kinase